MPEQAIYGRGATSGAMESYEAFRRAKRRFGTGRIRIKWTKDGRAVAYPSGWDKERGAETRTRKPRDKYAKRLEEIRRSL
jgi:hypothetical protein